MKKTHSVFVVTVLLSLAHNPTFGQATYGYEVWSSSADTLRGAEIGRRCNLRDNFLVPGSERVSAGSRILSPDEYEINYRLGVIRINAPLPDSTLVVVRYRRKPITLNPVYSLREVEMSEPGGVDTAIVSIPSRPKNPRVGVGNLTFGGTKSISFTVGNNRGTSLDQSLQVSIEGQLTPTINVKALLSDNNLPVQPEGNTEELEYLDQVYVEIEGTHARTTLGDFGFQNTVSSFSPLTRQLKGVTAEAWIDRGRVTFAGAESKGEFRTLQFRGTSGLQGPYELLSASRNTGEVIIAGTERLYLDGRRLTRGQNQDYTVDYDAGTVTFTPKVLITRDTEIAVDYEVTQYRYDRSTLFTAAESTALPGGLDLHFLYARERDDKDSPKNESFTDEELEILREAGNDPSRALTSGVTPTEVGRGDYVLVPADTVAGIPEHFEFDDSTGNYDISLVEVDRGEGDYELGGISSRGIRYYRFVGEGRGNYVVGKLLPLPESVSLVTARLQRTRGEHVSLDAEWNVSEYDRNLFSALDKDDNYGDAGQVALSVDNLPVGVGRIGFSGSLNTLDHRFKSFDRARPAYFYRDWNLENVSLSGRETIQEYAGTFARHEWATLKYSLGRIDRDDVAGTKHEGTARLGAGEDRVATARVFDTRTVRPDEVRTREHLTATAAFGLWNIRPSAAYATETYLQNARAESDSGIAYERIGVRLSDRSAESLGFNLSLENRDTREVRAAFQDWTDTRRDQTVSAGIAVRGRGSVQGEFQVTHREEKNLLVDDKTTTDLARLKGFARSSRAGLRANVDYEISQTAARTLVKSVVFVGDGNGDYNAQGDLVGKGQGAYAVVYSPTTNNVPTNRVNFNFRLVWKKTRARGGLSGRGAEDGTDGGGLLSWIASNVSLDQTITVTEESTHDRAWKIYLMLPSALQRNGTTVFGATSIRQEWTLLDAYPSVSLKIRYERRDEEDNRFEGVNEERFFGQHLVRLSHSLSSWLTATGEVSRDIRSRGGAGIDAGSGGSYDITALSGLGGVGFRLPGGNSIDVDVKMTNQEDRVSDAVQTLVTFRPKATLRVTRMISVFGSYDLTRVWDVRDAEVKPLVFSNEGNSHRWNLTPTVRLSKYLSLVAAYNGRRETIFSGKRITDHELKLETRAFF